MKIIIIIIIIINLQVALDVDCFYVQCEEIDRNLRGKNPRPLAIGQKHIIVS
jgi:nucleotidyltransferase/DNA polymerase involved in DNA repair